MSKTIEELFDDLMKNLGFKKEYDSFEPEFIEFHAELDEEDFNKISEDWANSNTIMALENTNMAQVPNHTGDDDMDDYICPNCCTRLATVDYYLEDPSYLHFCFNCGQKLDWEDAWNRGKIVKINEEN